MPTPTDSAEYQQKKRFYDSLLTVFGRKPVQEALQDPDCEVHRLHLAESNRSAAILDDIIRLAKKKNAEIVYHDRQALSRISKNAKQDQGVAVDLVCRGYEDFREFLARPQPSPCEIIALDRITNPQNLGMIIRSVCAGSVTALLLPKKGCAKIDPLVIKASTGTLFRTRILRCDDLNEALQAFRQQNYRIYGLSSHASETIGELGDDHNAVYVLGNETDGISAEVAALCDHQLAIPMRNGVESLNVAVTASLLAFRRILRGNR